MEWIKENIVAILALIVAIVGTSIAYYSSNKSSDVTIAIFGTNKSFLEEYLSLGKQSTELLLNAEILNSADSTKLLSVSPSLKINVYRYQPDSLVKVAYFNIPFVPETKDFEAYEVTAESTKIESGKELSANTYKATAIINTLISSIDECINCRKSRFPIANGYSHSIIHIHENNTFPLNEDSNVDWLSKQLENSLTLIVEDAVFRASSTDEGIPLFASGFKKFGNNWSNAIESLFIEYEITLVVETEDEKKIETVETFYSLAHLIPEANK